MDKEALLNHTYCLVFFKINITKLFFIPIFLINFDSTKTDREMTFLKINNQLIAAKLFKTRNSALKFIAKKQGRKILFMKSGQYYVNIYSVTP